MDPSARRTCDLCGERPATDQINFSRPLDGLEKVKYAADAAKLDMLLCEVCGARTFKHLKRFFTLKHLGLNREARRRFNRLT